MSMKISDGSIAIVGQPLPEEGPPILRIDDGTESPCPRSSDLDGIAAGTTPEVSLPDPPADPPLDGSTIGPWSGDTALRLAAFRA